MTVVKEENSNTNDTSSHLRNSGKEEQLNLKGSRMKEIVKLRKNSIKQKIGRKSKMSETNSWFTEKINKIDTDTL